MSEKLEVGSIVEGKVIRVKPFGAIVSIGEQAQGLVHISQVANSYVQDINDHVKVGDTVTVKVLSVDPETNKIALSMKEALPKEARRTRGDRPFHSHKQPQEQKTNPAEEYFKPQTMNPSADFEEKMREWMKQSNERQTSLNKRANKRSY